MTRRRTAGWRGSTTPSWRTPTANRRLPIGARIPTPRAWITKPAAVRRRRAGAEQTAGSRGRKIAGWQRPGRRREPAIRSTTAAKLHLVRGTLITLLGAVLPFLIMASDRRWSFSVPVGFAGCLIASLGILDYARRIRRQPDATSSQRSELSKVAPRLIELVASGIVLVAALRLAVAGVLPKPILTAAVLVTSSFIWMVVALFRFAQSIGVGLDRRERRRTRPLAAAWLLAGRAQCAALPAAARLLFAQRSVGNALRRGRARDAGARRLDLAVVGAGRLVLVEAGARLLDAGAVLLPARRALHARPDAGAAAAAAASRSPSGRRACRCSC